MSKWRPAGKKINVVQAEQASLAPKAPKMIKVLNPYDFGSRALFGMNIEWAAIWD